MKTTEIVGLLALTAIAIAVITWAFARVGVDYVAPVQAQEFRVNPWVRLEQQNGQEYWVRRDSIVAIHRNTMSISEYNGAVTVKLINGDRCHCRCLFVGSFGKESLMITLWRIRRLAECFSPHSVKRAARYFWQRRTRGWDDSDTWGLDHTIAKFTLPRLRRFKELTVSYPRGLTWKEWTEVLDDMIYAMEVSADLYDEFDDDVDWERAQRGYKAFGTYFRDLWS